MTSLRAFRSVRDRVRRSDAGFTLTELLVTIIIFAIVGAAITTAATSGLQHQRQIQDRSDALAQARTVVQRVDRDIRSASPLAAASSTSLAMLEQENSSSTLACYLVQATSATKAELVYTAYASPTTSTTCPSAATSGSKILLTDLINTSTTPVFSFTPTNGFTSSDAALDTSTCQYTSGANAGTYEATCIGIITVQISVEPSSLNGAVNVSDKGTELRNAS